MIQLSRKEAIIVAAALKFTSDNDGPLTSAERNLATKLEMFLQLEQTPQLTEQASESQNEAATDV